MRVCQLCLTCSMRFGCKGRVRNFSRLSEKQQSGAHMSTETGLAVQFHTSQDSSPSLVYTDKLFHHHGSKCRTVEKDRSPNINRLKLISSFKFQNQSRQMAAHP